MQRSFSASLSFLCLLMTLPLWGILAFKWPISSDLIFYATSARAFSTQFWDGDWYPRWLLNTNAGYGSPVFVFYSPLAFYAMSAFEFIAPLDPHGFGRIILGIMTAIMVSGIAARNWLSRHFDRAAAEKGALLYAGFPYLLLHVYGGFAVAQLWGIALLPLLMSSAGDVCRHGFSRMPKFAVAGALLLSAHLPTFVMFAAVPCLYVLVFSPPGRRVLNGVLAGCFSALGIGLGAVCLLPALLNRSYIATERFLDGNLAYARNFLDTYSQIGIVAMVLPLLVLYLELPQNMRRRLTQPPVRFWAAVNALFFCMTLPVSKPLWDALPALQHLQFPFRFFLVMLPGTAYIASVWLPHARSRTIYKGMFAAGLLCAAIYSSEISFFHKNSPVAAILKYNLLARPEYQTRWMEKDNVDFRANVPAPFLDKKSATIVEGKGEASILEQDSRTIRLHADIVSREATVQVQRFYFPGWEATPGRLTVSSYNSLVSLHLPRGSYSITLRLPWFAGEREGAIISIGALITLWTLYTFSRLQAQHAATITKT